ncbi:MAG: alpha/beta hydrolase [Desulfoferrobacter sp.]
MPKLKVHDVDLYYESTGRGQPLLFIHGLGSSLRDWERQVPFFSRNHQVITLDVRGHGRSDKPLGRYSIQLFAADIAELIRLLGLAPVHIVGISMGGMIAFQMAVSKPELLKSLVVVNSGPEFVLHGIRQKLPFLWRRLIVRFMGMRKLGEILGKRLFPKPSQESLRRLIAERWAQNDRKTYLNSLRALNGWSVTNRLEDIRCPTLILTAEQDYTPPAYKEAYAARIPLARVLAIPDSRHLTPLDQPDAFNHALEAFLSSIIAPASIVT